MLLRLFLVRIRGAAVGAQHLRIPTSLISAIGLSYNRFRVPPHEGVGQTDNADKAKHPPAVTRSIHHTKNTQCHRQMVIYGY